MAKAPAKKFSGGAQREPAGSEQRKTAVFKMNTDLGQHILKNPLVAQGIVDKSDIKPSDTVLEVGPGTGNLTVRILEKARKVIAVEMDPRMAAELTKRVQGKPEQKKLEIMLGDCIKTELPYFDVCISNTPYQISSPLVFKLLNQPRPPRVSVLMFQHEFAMRLLARPGDSLYCRLSVNVQMWAKVSHVMKVGRGNFRPPPNVESSVVKIEVKNPRPPIDFNEWDGLLRVCFVRKNKTINAGFKTTAVLAVLEKNYQTWLSTQGEIIPDGTNLSDVVKQKVNKILTDTGIGEMRSAKCDQTEFLTLLNEFHKAGIYFA